MTFLAHVNRKFKWAILIAFCTLSVCLLNFHIFDFFSKTAGPNFKKKDILQIIQGEIIKKMQK